MLIFLIFAAPFFIFFFSKPQDEISYRILWSFTLTMGIVFFFTIITSIFLESLIFLPVVVLFLSTITASAIYLYYKKDRVSNKKVKKKISLIFLITIVLSLFLRLVFLYKIDTILGADVGRFANIVHTWKVKDRVTTYLPPYDLATKFFYFPANFFLPLLGEVEGINSIHFLTYLVFAHSFIFPFIVYLITRMFLKEEYALSTYFFSSFFLDPTINIGVFGVFGYSIGIVYFLSVVFLLLKYYFTEKIDKLFFIFSFFLISGFHAYLLVLLIPFVFSLVFHTLTKKNIKKFLNLLKLLPLPLVSLLLFSPLFYLFTPDSIYISFNKEKIADLMMFSFLNRKANLQQRLSFIFFSTPNGLIYSPFLFVGLLCFLFFMYRNRQNEKIWFVFYSFLFSLILLYGLFDDLNHARSYWLMWLFYSMGLGYVFSKSSFNLIFLLVLSVVIQPSLIFYILNLHPVYETGHIPWIIWPEFKEVMEFIKQNVPLDSTFLIDGGGAGCTGASSSYGERIFDLTSRKIFYFTDYCWAEYDENDYRKRLEIYRKISINPDDKDSIISLKNFNVTHVFIGPISVGLDKNLFLNSKYYKLTYERNDFYIFEIL